MRENYAFSQFQIIRRLHRIERKVDAVFDKLGLISWKEDMQMALIDDVLARAAEIDADVTSTRTVIDAIKVQQQGMKDQILALTEQLAAAIAAGDPVKIQAVKDALEALGSNIDAEQESLNVIAGTPQASNL